ncbi:MAG: choice-of-anchor D domain-containing protein [Acidobacteriota bacterium]
MKLVFTPGEMGERRAGLEVHAEMPDSPARLEIVGVGIAPLLEMTPASLSFGAQDVGSTSRAKTVTLSNRGTAVLEIQKLEISGGGSRDFRLRKDECSNQSLVPSANCDIAFNFAPRAAGVRSVELVVDSDTLIDPPPVGISGEGIWTGAAFDVDPQSLDFERQMVGSGAAVRKVVVTNRQSTPVRGLEVRLAGAGRAYAIEQETCSGRAVAPGESCSARIRFGPPSEGDFAGLLEIGNPRQGVVGLELSGQGVAPRWVLLSNSFDLGSVRVGSESDPARIELANEGSAAAEVTAVVVSGADGKRFRKQRDQCTAKRVEPGKRCTVEITFSAEREGPHRAELKFEPEFGVQPKAVALSAIAAAPRLGVDLELVDFGKVHRTTRSEVVLTASNLGTASLQVGGFEIEGSSAQSFRLLGGTCFPQATVPPRSQCTLRLGFDPVAEGRATARLLIEHDGMSGPKAIPLAGIGLAPPAPEIFLSSRTLDFGPQPVGERSPILTLTVNAAGTGHLRLESFEIEGPDADSFQIVPAPCQAAPTLVPGSSCSVGIRMIPSGPGARRARLVIRHNAASTVSTTDLSGEGLGTGG